MLLITATFKYYEEGLTMHLTNLDDDRSKKSFKRRETIWKESITIKRSLKHLRIGQNYFEIVLFPEDKIFE